MARCSIFFWGYPRASMPPGTPALPPRAYTRGGSARREFLGADLRSLRHLNRLDQARVVRKAGVVDAGVDFPGRHELIGIGLEHHPRLRWRAGEPWLVIGRREDRRHALLAIVNLGEEAVCAH